MASLTHGNSLVHGNHADKLGSSHRQHLQGVESSTPHPSVRSHARSRGEFAPNFQEETDQRRRNNDEIDPRRRNPNGIDPKRHNHIDINQRRRHNHHDMDSPHGAWSHSEVDPRLHRHDEADLQQHNNGRADPRRRSPEEVDVRRRQHDEGNPGLRNHEEGDPRRRNYEKGDPRRRNHEEGDPRRRNHEEGDPRRRNHEEGDPRRRNHEEGDPRRRNHEESDPRRRNYEEGDPRRRTDEEGDPRRRKHEEVDLRRRKHEESDLRRRKHEESDLRRRNHEESDPRRRNQAEGEPRCRNHIEVDTRRRNHESRPRQEGSAGHGSHASGSSSEASGRRSSRHYDHYFSGHQTDSSKTSERHGSVHSRYSGSETSTPVRRSSHCEPKESERRSRDNAEHLEGPLTRRREEMSSRHSADRNSHRSEHEPRSANNDARAHRRSGSREPGDSESERKDRRSNSRVGREARDDQLERNGIRRSGSVTRAHDAAADPRELRSSYQAHREGRAENAQDLRRRRSLRADYEAADDHRERRSCHDEPLSTKSPRNNRTGVSETRLPDHNDYNGQQSMIKSSNVPHNGTGSYDSGFETAHNISHSKNRSSSKQSLAKEDIETSHRSLDPRMRSEAYSSKSRQGNEHRHSTEAARSQRRDNVVADYVDTNNPNNMVRQSSTSTSDTSKETSQNSRSEAGQRPSRSSSRDENFSIESNETLPQHYKDAFISDETAHTPGQLAKSSSNRQIAPGFTISRSEQEGTMVPKGRHDVSLSRRSSSSRSNQDTGFASSSSSSRRDDSQSRFSSDVSPSHFGEEDVLRVRVEESKRRRSRNVSNNGLDVPATALIKEQSLASSGKGDSGFDEPATGSTISNRANRLTVEDSIRSSKDTDNKPELLKNLKNELKSSNTSIYENLLASKSVSRSSSSIAKESNEASNPLSRSEVSEWTSSTSTLRGGNATSVTSTSKTSVAGSIYSLLGRGNKDQQEENSASISVSERWRRLKQSILPADEDYTSGQLSGKESAAAIFSAAAAKFMSSLPRMSNTFTKTFSSSTDLPATENPLSQTRTNDSAVLRTTDSTISLAKTDNSATSKPRSDNSVTVSQNKTDKSSPSKARSETSATSRTSKLEVSLTPQMKVNDVHERRKIDHISSNHSIASAIVANDNVTSQRPSIISTTLSSHNKRANIYAIMTERKDSPDSEDSGEMTPPPLDADMKRRSKEVDTELTSFLPAEMSKREEKLHDAARVNDADALRNLLKDKVNVNCRNSLDRTALHWAAANGNLEAAEVLIEAGADLEAKDKYGMRAVLWAAWFGHLSVLKALINAGANTRVTNKQGLGMLHCAAENNHVSVISFIFEALEPHDVNQRDKNDRTPLQSAAESGRVEAVERLLEAKADINKKDKGGMTAVHLAAKHGHIDVLKKLLLQGIEVDDRDVDGKTALHLAAEAGFKESVDILLDYTANPNSETVKEVTPLHLAAQEGHVNVCRSLVKYGCNVNAQNFQGNSALHIAAHANHKEVARILIDAKCELDLPNTRMQTSLHVAVESGHLDVVQILLAGGASLNAREKSGKSALQLAARGNYVAVVDMLIKAERYYANTREYHDKDVGYVDPDTYLRNPQHPHAQQMKDVLWKLAMKQLKPTDWKKLAYHWHFTPEHVRAIEQEYTGTTSYKEHCYRLLTIWLHGVRKDENVLKLLFEALVSIDKKNLAESVRRKVNLQAEKPCSPSLCSVS